MPISTCDDERRNEKKASRCFSESCFESFKRSLEKFGDKITFWGGGVDTQKILPFGSHKEVSDQIEQQINIFSPGGGFIFAAVHNIQANVPTENIIKLFETAILHRNY